MSRCGACPKSTYYKGFSFFNALRSQTALHSKGLCHQRNRQQSASPSAWALQNIVLNCILRAMVHIGTAMPVLAVYSVSRRDTMWKELRAWTSSSCHPCTLNLQLLHYWKMQVLSLTGVSFLQVHRGRLSISIGRCAAKCNKGALCNIYCPAFANSVAEQRPRP